MTRFDNNQLKQATLPYLIKESGLFSDGNWVESKDQDQNGDVRLIQLADVGVGVYLDKSARFMTSEKAEKLKCTYLKEGDILIARMPHPIGRACVFPGDAKPCVTVVDVCILRPDQCVVDSNWLLHRVNSPGFNHEITRWVTGTTRQRISRGNLSKISFPLPPLEEQKRIAAILDKADAIRRKRRQAIKLADEFLRSVFLDMFGDPVSNSKNWDRKPIENTIEDIKPGWSIKGNNRDRKPGEWGVLKISAVTSGRFLPEECKVVAINSINREMVKPQKGDLLFTRANTRELVAATCIVERDYDQLFLPDKIWKIIPKQNILRPEFLRFVLSHPRYRDTIRKQATGTSGSMLNVSQTKIKHMIIPVPPLAFQEKFSKIFWQFYHIRNQVDESIQNATVLFNSISQQAFRGEL